MGEKEILIIKWGQCIRKKRKKTKDVKRRKEIEQ